MTEPRTVRAAVVQSGGICFDTPATLERLRPLVARAAGEGARLVVVPEAFVGGYPKGTTFGTVVGDRDPAGREWFRRYHAGAIDLPGPELGELCAMAREHEVTLVAGVVERDGWTLYCTVVFIGPDGAYLGKHRKLMPTAAERLVWGRGDGSTLTVVDTGFGKIGAVICWENYMPLLRTTMYGKGIQIYCAPTADQRDTWLATMRHIAFEGRCFVLSANQFCRRSDYPIDYDTTFSNDPEAIYSRGGSCIVNPLGEIIAGPDYEGETILIADLDLTDITRANLDFDAIGHYSRPDLFQLTVNETPMPRVAGISPAIPTSTAEPASSPTQTETLIRT